MSQVFYENHDGSIKLKVVTAVRLEGARTSKPKLAIDYAELELPIGAKAIPMTGQSDRIEFPPRHNP